MADQANNYEDLLDLDLDNLHPDELINMNWDSNQIFNESSGFPDTSLNELQEPVSTQQPYNPPPFASTFNQAAPTFTPPPGYAYHPSVGWHIPLDPALIPAQPQMPTFTLYNALPFGENTQMPEPSRPSTGKTKRKYGPGVYGEEQAKRRAIGDDSGPCPVSRESVDFHVSGRKIKQTKGTASKPKKQSQKGGRSSDLKAATVKTCRCPAAQAVKAAKVPRPANSFMLFKADFGSDQLTSLGEKRGKDNPNTCRTAGAAWNEHKAENDETYARYVEMAKEEARKHREAHPDYKYDPSVLIKAKFGRPSCTCGAYVKNSAALLLKRRGPGPSHNAAIDEDEDDEDDIGDDIGDDKKGDGYVMPTTRSMSRANSLVAQAPIDQTIPFDFNYNLDNNFYNGTGNVPDFGPQNESQWNTQLNHTNAAKSTYEPPVLRRSTRLGQQSVVYGEEVANYEEDFDGDLEMSNTASRHKRRPSPIVISRNTSPKTSGLVNISPGSDGPASRTRSKSVSFDESQFQEASMDDSLFGEPWESEEEDVGENIVVATPMTAMSNVSPRNRSDLALPTMQSRTTKGRSRGSR